MEEQPQQPKALGTEILDFLTNPYVIVVLMAFCLGLNFWQGQKYQKDVDVGKDYINWQRDRINRIKEEVSKLPPSTEKDGLLMILSEQYKLKEEQIVQEALDSLPTMSDPINIVKQHIIGEHGEERISTGGMTLTSTDFELCYEFDGVHHQMVGIMFSGMDLPKNATIDNAQIQFSVDATNTNRGTNDPIISIRTQKGSNPTDPTSTAYNVSSRTYTSAVHNWTIPRADWDTAVKRGAGQLTSNFAEVLQETIDDPAYVQGDNIFVKFQGDGVDESMVWAENTAPHQPDLLITYRLPIAEDAAAFIDAIGTLNATEQTAIQNLVAGLKANGTWSKYKAIYPFVGGTASAHKFNLKDPSQYQITWYGTWIHNEFGAEGDGTTAWGNTNFNDNNFTYASGKVDFMVGYYSNKDQIGGGGSRSEMGVDYQGIDGKQMVLQVYDGSNGHFGLGYNTVYTTGTDFNTNMGYANFYANNGAVKFATNGAIETAQASAQTIAEASNLPFAINSVTQLSNGNADDDNAGARSTRRTAMVVIGEGFTDAEITNDYATIEAFQKALSREADLFPYDPYPTDMIVNGNFDDANDWGLLNGSTISDGIARIVNNGNLGSTGGNWSLSQLNVFSETATENFNIKLVARRVSGTGTLQISQEYWGLQDAQTQTSALTTEWQLIEWASSTSQTTGRDRITFGGMTVGDVWEIKWISLQLL